MAVTSSVLTWTSVALIPTEVTLFLWATACFAAVPALQVNVVTFGKAAPNLVSTLNIGAFSIGNALGAWVGAASSPTATAWSTCRWPPPRWRSWPCW